MKNILIVDDNRFFSAGLSMGLYFYLTGFNILTAESGRRALEILESVPVDLIVTDLDMPFMDGHDLLMSIRKSHPKLPVFVMAGSVEPEIEKRLVSLGVSRCIEKPFGFKELSDMIAVELGVLSPAAA